MCFHEESKAEKWQREEPEKLVAMVKLVRNGQLFAAWPTPNAADVAEVGRVIKALKHWHPEKDLVVDLTDVRRVNDAVDATTHSVTTYLRYWDNYDDMGGESIKFIKGLLKVEGDPFEYIMLNAPKNVWRRAAWHLHNVEHERLGGHSKLLEHEHVHA